jgi:sarcosine reductase
LRLELNVVKIGKVKAGGKTAVKNGVLAVDCRGLAGLLERDARLDSVEIGLTNPGEKTRIIRVVDVIEPRSKIGESGQEYLGGLDRLGTVGRGTTCVLRGAAVVLSEYRRSEDRGRAATGVIDMWGAGAEIGPYGTTCNVVIMANPAEGTTQDEYRAALKIAGLKAAVYLARAGAGLAPDETEVYDIPWLAKSAGDGGGLPRVAYIFQVLTNQFEPLAGDPVLYGNNIGEIVPSVLHPNEILDGAVTAPFSSYFMDTYGIQNHPVVLELYKNHGRSLEFCGVIISNAPNNAPEYERTAIIASNLAKWTLKADGAVLTKCGGGAPELVMARTAQKCEQLGIKTTLALLHMGMDTTEISLKASTIFSDVPEVDAMVSMGTPAGEPFVTLEPAERVIGMADGSEHGGAATQARQIRGSMSQIGDSRLIAVRY